MRVRVNFKMNEGNEEESFVVDTSFAKAKNPKQQHLLDCIQAALLDPDRTAFYKLYADEDFSNMLSKSRKSDDCVTIWY